MNIEVKTSAGIHLIPMETRFLSQRKVFIEGEITQESACEIAKQILLLTKEDDKKPIDVMINSPGGEINAGLLMYDVIQASKAPLRMFCLGIAYSMGAVLFASGNNGRYILPHSELMLHEPLLGNKIAGNASSIKSISDTLMETRKRMNEILARHTKKTEEEVEAATSFDHYFKAEECVDFGLADEIIEFDRLFDM